MISLTPSLFQMVLRGLTYYRGQCLATAAGVAVGTAVLTGALLVGDSMKAGLRDTALARLGPVQHALISQRFIRRETASALGDQSVGMILVQGAAVSTRTQSRAGRVSVYGVDTDFWKLWESPRTGTDRDAWVSEALARELEIAPGDEILLRLETRQIVPVESLLGRRETAGTTLRLRVEGVLPPEGPGHFSLTPQTVTPRNVFVPLSTMQRVFKQTGRVNAIVCVADQPPETAFREALAVTDYHLRLRLDEAHRSIVLESDRFLIEPTIEQAAIQAAREVSLDASAILVSLVNSIALERTGRDAPRARLAVPYSTAAALERVSDLTLVDGSFAPSLSPDEILINEWTADQLQARVGDRVRLTYYVIGPFGRLETAHARLTLRGIVRMSGLGAEPGLTPRYEGITDTRRISDWDPPFPMDMKRIEPPDEDYWDRFRATPKVFVSLDAGQRLWAEADPRFGRLTSFRLTPRDLRDLKLALADFERHLLDRLDPARCGMSFEAVRRRAIDSAEGSTDFGMLFLGFSFFLIFAATMLVALLFRLGVERRATQVGLLLALGWTPGRTIRLFLMEGAATCLLGTLIGLAAAMGYAALMLTGLTSWWADAVRGPSLRLHASATSLLIGGSSSLLISMLSVAWSIRGLKRRSARSLLAGVTEDAGGMSRGSRRVRRAASVACGLLAAATLLLPHATDRLPVAVAFFLGGALLLLSALLVFSTWLVGVKHIHHDRRIALSPARLGRRNILRNPRRSLLTVGLMACGCFVVVAVGANRLTADPADLRRTSGVGGCTLIGESVAPLLHDLNQPEGRAGLNLSDEAANALRESRVFAFRLKHGDDTSCLNPYQATSPRLLGATPAWISRGGFSFVSTLADTPETRDNPWRLLDRAFDDGAVPCIGDANTVLWLLHSGLGRDFVMQDERGESLRLRFVALLSGSVLQGELILAERDFVRRFPSVAGYRFFLIETPAVHAAAVKLTLERELSAFGLDLESTIRRLQEYLEIENTYLSAFATIGGMGLMLGTIGLAAVLLRSLLERRAELALLGALGWRRRLIERLVFSENALLLLVGLSIGLGAAMLAVAPQFASRAGPTPWPTLAFTLLLIAVVGLLAIRVSLRLGMRGSLLASLRRE